MRSSTVTLEISTAMAGAAVVRSCRTLAIRAVGADPLNRCANVKRRIRIPLPRLHDLESLRFERGAYLRRELQHDVALVNAARPARAQVRSAVRRIEQHNIQPRSRGSCVRRWSGRGWSGW